MRTIASAMRKQRRKERTGTTFGRTPLIVSPAEGDAIVGEAHEAMVGDGDAMGVAGQVVENLLVLPKGGLT